MAAQRIESLVNLKGISDLSNDIRRPDSDNCYLCRSDIRHSLEEHEHAVAHGVKVIKKVRTGAKP